MADREFRVLVRDPKSNMVRQVFRKGRGFRASRRFRRDGDRFTRQEARLAREWAEERGLVPFVTKSRYPFLVLDSDTKMVREPLAEKLNDLGRRSGRYLWVGEGWRTHAQQWAFWNAYVARGKRPPLVAFPGTSNHESGWAADLSVLLSGRGGSYVNVGRWRPSVTIRRMKKLGLGLSVPGEPWHVEITRSFAGL